MNVEEIKKRKRVGDNELVAQLLSNSGNNVSAGNVSIILRERPESKWYDEIIQAFTYVIETHERMIAEYRKPQVREPFDEPKEKCFECVHLRYGCCGNSGGILDCFENESYVNFKSKKQ
jgi:hypothetical protein